MPNVGATKPVRRPGLPVGGTTGQSLSKTSSDNYVTRWVSPGAPGPWAANNWYDTRILASPVSLLSSQVFAVAATSAYYLPFFVPAQVTLTTIGVLSSATGGALTLAIYGFGTDNKPNGIKGSAAVTVSATSGVGATGSLGSLVLPGGWYYACIANASASVAPGVATVAASAAWAVGSMTTDSPTLYSYPPTYLLQTAFGSLSSVPSVQATPLPQTAVAITPVVWFKTA